MDDSQYRDFESESNPERGAGVAADIKAEARQRYEQVKDSGKQAIGESQSRIAEHVERLGRALKHGGHSLHDEQELSLGDYANRLGEGCDRLANYLRSSKPQDIVDDLSSGVRRHPELALGGLFLAGVGLARFLRASAGSGRSAETLAGKHSAPRPERLEFSAEGQPDELVGTGSDMPRSALYDSQGKLINPVDEDTGSISRASSL